MANYIILGKDRDTRRRLSLSMARFHLCDKVQDTPAGYCLACGPCQRVTRGTSPAVFFWTPEDLSDIPRNMRWGPGIVIIVANPGAWSHEMDDEFDVGHAAYAEQPVFIFECRRPHHAPQSILASAQVVGTEYVEEVQ